MRRAHVARGASSCRTHRCVATTGFRVQSLWFKSCAAADYRLAAFCENVLSARWSAYDPKRTFFKHDGMSAFGGKADIATATSANPGSERRMDRSYCGQPSSDIRRSIHRANRLAWHRDHDARSRGAIHSSRHARTYRKRPGHGPTWA
jgi:hypothetical protein